MPSPPAKRAALVQQQDVICSTIWRFPMCPDFCGSLAAGRRWRGYVQRSDGIVRVLTDPR
jgi:hypothetical protein